jgi:methanogenic corrinoid protein MtbC1
VYTVKHAAAMTGIPVDRLRMWERRYGVVAPVRSEGGYRLYDDAAIARLTAMQALVQAGWAPRRAAMQVQSGTTLGSTGAPLATDGAPDEPPPGGRTAEELDLLVRAARRLDSELLTRALDGMFAGNDLEDIAEAWLMPALARLGQAWRRGEISVAGEHFVSAGVHRRLSTVLDAVPSRVGAPVVAVGLARGSRHELGVLAFAALLARAGIDVVYVGGDVPPDSWVVAVTAREPAAVVIGVPCVEDAPAVHDTAAALAAARPDLPVLLGGRHQDRVGSGRALGHSLVAAAHELARQLIS